MTSSAEGNISRRSSRQALGLLAEQSSLTPCRHLAEATINRRRFISTVLGVSTLTQLSSCTSQKAPPTVTYAFSDEFDGPAGSAPDPSKWGYNTGGGGWGNDELEVYTSSRANSFQDGHGNLVIRATKRVQTSGGRTTTTYRSARLMTLGKFSAYHGNFEARIKLDIQRGLWPAWWALGANFGKVRWPACGEVDMLENYGGSTVETSIHTPNNTDSGVFTKFADISADDDWHIWRMWWQPKTGGFTFYKDGLEYMTVEPAQMPNWCFSSGVPMFMILNLAVGGKVGPPPDSVQFPVDLLVDYVRVW
jgi:beta-glucanase (GH16 family)